MVVVSHTFWTKLKKCKENFSASQRQMTGIFYLTGDDSRSGPPPHKHTNTRAPLISASPSKSLVPGSSPSPR